MSSTFRFPYLKDTATHQNELNQVITLANGITGLSALPVGGINPYASLLPWKLENYSTETPYCSVAIEWSANATVTIGDGSVAKQIGLFGEITGVGKFLIGVLGMGLGNPAAQIPIISGTVGFSQIVQLVAIYDALSVGGISSAINIAGEQTFVTVRARPIRERGYLG